MRNAGPRLELESDCFASLAMTEACVIARSPKGDEAISLTDGADYLTTVSVTSIFTTSPLTLSVAAVN